VTGASGFLGGVLLEQLVPIGKTRVLHRRIDGWRTHWSSLGTEVVVGDLDDMRALESLVRGVDTVYHCAATMQKNDPGLSRQVNIVGTENVVRAAAAAGVRRFAYVSSISVYAATQRYGAILTEAIEPERVKRLNNYGHTKYEGELVVRRLGRALGLSYTIIRPTNIYGPQSGPWFLQWARTLERLPFAIGDLPIDVVYVDDVVDAMMQAAHSPAAVDQVFNVGHEMIRMNRFILEIARVTGQRARTIPPPLDRLLRAAIDRLYRVATRKHMSMSLVRPAYYPHLKARAFFGYSPHVTLADGFERIAEWYRSTHGAPSHGQRLESGEECHA
jgi:nucleoside-diphosphate-sugar epimerase